jgi:hypothetical protein
MCPWLSKQIVAATVDDNVRHDKVCRYDVLR